MTAKLPAALVKQLKHLIARAISDAKAYDVPALCTRLGLAEGTEQEAFSSKYKYAQRRLVDVSAERLLPIARELAEDEAHFELTEEIAKIDERDTPAITTLTRRKLITLFETTPLATNIDEIELLKSVWPIGSFPAPTGSSESTLEQHILFRMFIDDKFPTKQVLEAAGVLTCSRSRLSKFLAAVTSPEAHPPKKKAELAGKLDALLRLDGYSLVVAGQMSGSPFFEVRPAPNGAPADEGISTTLAEFNPTHVHARWKAALDRRTVDPQGAITLARTLLEDVCKWILAEAGQDYEENDDLPALYRQLAKLLKLAPDDHTEKIFKQILGSCQSVVESLGALRNKLSDAHSSGPKRARPQPRHAELAVNLAGAMATFLVSTWQERQRESEYKL